MHQLEFRLPQDLFEFDQVLFGSVHQEELLGYDALLTSAELRKLFWSKYFPYPF